MYLFKVQLLKALLKIYKHESFQTKMRRFILHIVQIAHNELRNKVGF
jgi:hypothetical protein